MDRWVDGWRGVGRKQQTITSYTTAAQFASFSSSWSGFYLAPEPGRDRNTVNQMRPQQRSHRHDSRGPTLIHVS